MILKYSIIIIKYTFLILIIFYLPINSIKSDEITIEEVTIKKRKAIFSKNYSTAKKVQTYATKGDYEKSRELMMEMSENYVNLISLFPSNTMQGFKTEALPAIWENKDEFNNLMKKASNDMIKLASIIETADDVKGALNKMMWSNCKACHTKFRAPH
tara:strand:+ start:54 stop:524 length:471 start_codon:yes stop_codon:yes gene_type:complete